MPDENLPPLSQSVPETTQTPSSVIPPKKNFLYLWLLIGLIVILIIIGYFFFTNRMASTDSENQSREENIPTGTISATLTPNNSVETSNWKTYNNIKYNITLKYPDEIAVEEFPIRELNTDRLSFSNLDNAGDCINIVILPQNIGNTENLLDWIREDSMYEQNPNEPSLSAVRGKIMTYKNKYDAEVTGYWYEGVVESVVKNIFIKNKNQVFKFSASGCDTGDSYKSFPNTEDILEKMISTLSFTN